VNLKYGYVQVLRKCVRKLSVYSENCYIDSSCELGLYFNVLVYQENGYIVCLLEFQMAIISVHINSEIRYNICL
jgi:hypothetical protein